MEGHLRCLTSSTECDDHPVIRSDERQLMLVSVATIGKSTEDMLAHSFLPVPRSVESSVIHVSIL